MSGVALFTLGGTIAMSGDRGGGVVARLDGADLTADVPGLARTGIELAIHDAVPVPSAQLTFAAFVDVVTAASAAVRAGAAGVVVTQGTDTLEETAYLADLLWPHEAPFVVTGAMRNPTLAGADGPGNLVDAVRVAASAAARDLGAMVVFNDEIHAARTVRKTHATSTATFASPDTGPLGHVIEGTVRILARPATRPAPLPMPDAAALERTRVPLHTCALDDDGTLIHAIANATGRRSATGPASADPSPTGQPGTYPTSTGSADTNPLDTDPADIDPADIDPAPAGLVVAGFGVGHVPVWLVEALTGIAARMPVVLASRTGAGSVLADTYGAPGGERDLLARGLIPAGLLHPYKSRILLRTLLATGADRETCGRAFAEHG